MTISSDEVTIEWARHTYKSNPKAKRSQTPQQQLLSLNALISKLIHSNLNSKALQLFIQIHASHHLQPDHYTLSTTLTACANLRDIVAGNQIHSQPALRSSPASTFAAAASPLPHLHLRRYIPPQLLQNVQRPVVSALSVRFGCRMLTTQICTGTLLLSGPGIPIKATQRSQTPQQQLLSLNALTSKLTHSNLNSKALQLFIQIHASHHLQPDHYTLSTALTACANLRDTVAGNQIHAHAARAGYRGHAHVGNALLSLYAKCRDLESTRRMFDEIHSPDAYSWTTLLSAYAKSGHIDHALQLFDEVPRRNVAVWNAVITGCVDCGYREVAFDMFCRMHWMGVRHDHYSFASVLSLCCSHELLDSGKQVHSLVIRTGFFIRISVINALLTMYSSCGMIREAYLLFGEAEAPNYITFNAMISGLVGCGRDVEALAMFKKMKESCFGPTNLTFASVLSACSSSKMPKMGPQIHAQAIKMGFEDCVLVSNAAINMYSCCGDLEDAKLVFERLEEKDLVSWNSIINGYAQGNCYELAITIYRQMQRAGIEPDEFTFGRLIACSEFVKNTEMVQAPAAKNGLISNTQVGNALVSAFANCGMIGHAYQIFEEMPFRNLISWNSMVSGSVLNGFPVMGLELFREMQISDLTPNICTLSIVLSTCASISALRHGKQTISACISNFASVRRVIDDFVFKDSHEALLLGLYRGMLVDCPRHFVGDYATRMRQQIWLRLKVVFEEDGKEEFIAFPLLKTICLLQLPKLQSICSGSLPKLEQLKVKGCSKLEKIPLQVNKNPDAIPLEIRGDKEWWSNINFKGGEGVKQPHIIFKPWRSFY
ncbi:hypothetical protein AAC387_Pa02g3213 [Persea americana]